MNLADAFNNFSKTAFRLEGLPEYRVKEEAEALAHYDRTGRLPADFNSEWLDFLQQATSAGKRVERLRLLSEPPTKYERIELSAYPRSVAVGEVVHVVPRDQYAHQSDFWLFDDRLLADMRYAEDGQFMGAEVRECTQSELENAHLWYQRFMRASSAPSA